MRKDFVFLEFDGEKKTLAGWSRYYGIQYDVLRMRYKRYGADKAQLFKKVSSKNTHSIQMRDVSISESGEVQYVFRDVTKTLKEWCKQFGLPYDTVRMRIKRGVTGERVFDPVREYMK